MACASLCRPSLEATWIREGFGIRRLLGNGHGRPTGMLYLLPRFIKFQSKSLPTSSARFDFANSYADSGFSGNQLQIQALKLLFLLPSSPVNMVTLCY